VTTQMPMIGYAVSLTNRALGLELFGSPQEVLEQLRARGLIAGEVARLRETVLGYKKVLKAHPQMEFSGGPHAEAVLLLLDAIHRSDPTEAASIVADDPALLTDAHDGAYIPLLAAVWAGRLEVVQLLLANDATVDGTTHFGMTPLHWAAAGGYSAIAARLLEAGADAKRVSWFYAMPQDLALLNGRSETARLLAERSRIAPEMFSVEHLLTRLGWGART
jgi:Ankyrin repeats (3 copies)